MKRRDFFKLCGAAVSVCVAPQHRPPVPRYEQPGRDPVADIQAAVDAIWRNRNARVVYWMSPAAAMYFAASVSCTEIVQKERSSHEDTQ